MSGCVPQFTKKYMTRSSPNFPANKCRGQSLTGNDGINMYLSKKDSRGIYRWVKLTDNKPVSRKVSSRKSSSRKSSSHKSSSRKSSSHKSSSRKSSSRKYQIKKSGKCPTGYFKFKQIMKDSKRYGTKLPYFCSPIHHTKDRSNRKGSRKHSSRKHSRK
jgi:hypothetical protein